MNLDKLEERGAFILWEKRWVQQGGYAIFPVGGCNSICEKEIGNGVWTCGDEEYGCPELAAEWSRTLDQIVALHNAAPALVARFRKADHMEKIVERLKWWMEHLYYTAPEMMQATVAAMVEELGRMCAALAVGGGK